jgi:tRNA-specific 2-thiouridylase
VLAAMSGGVDSAVAAARAVDAGHEVVGVHMALARNPATGRTGARGCCTIEDAGDARRAADVIGIPFYVWDLAEQFTEAVVDDFVQEYAAGRTPNPCVRCNERIKFAALLDKAVALGFDAVATGHYARVEPGDPPRLLRAADAAKDQSYVLAVLPPERLERALLPLGTATSKDEVRAEAARRGLQVSAKRDSHDICFIPDGDTRGFLDAHVPRSPGAVLDRDGRTVGTHDGAQGYTVGQRRGLRLGTPAADGRPRYVLEVSVVDNTLTVGPAEALAVDEVEAGEAVVWLAAAPAPGTTLLAQVRAHGRAVPCEVRSAGPDGVRVHVAGALTGVSAGQTLVLYDGDRVVGSGTVTGTTGAS